MPILMDYIALSQDMTGNTFKEFVFLGVFTAVGTKFYE